MDRFFFLVAETEIPTRHEFMHISPLGKVLFYVLIFGSIAVMVAQIWQRSRLWMRGRPIGWKPRPVHNILTYILGQKKVRTSRKRSGAPMHLSIFYGFCVLFLATTLLAINTYSPFKFHQGNYYLWYEFLVDTLGFLFVIGVSWAIGRRLLAKPASLTQAAQDLWALALLWVLGVTGYVLEAARIANDPKPWDHWSPIGYAMAPMLGAVSNQGYAAIWWFHMVWVALFFALLPRMRLKHIVVAVLSAGGKSEQPMGELKPISMEEVEETGKIGAAEASDLDRWRLMSFDACMECGRCTEVCPANGVGKILNPKQIVQDSIRANIGGLPLADSLGEESLWACTTCNACVEACPVLIRHVDTIVDARRWLVAEGRLTGSAATMLRQTGSTGNAWGAPASQREDWMKDLNVPLARDGAEFDVLLWVGCAGATDPGAIRTTRAVAELLDKAGVKYACLGKEERCTGDAARRVGDEFLYQEMAQSNVATFEKYGVKKIVTPCPHCLNTLKNEYPQFDGNYEVSHHTQFLQTLVRDGKLKAASPAAGEVTYHDPCYLARVNNESDAPRALVGDHTRLNSDAIPSVAGLENLTAGPKTLAEPEHHGRKTLCCGAGGGRMWMDETPDQRPSDRRSRELLATGAKTVAVGCPFCRIMLDAGIKSVAPEEEIRLVDLAEMLQEANPNDS